MNETKKIVGDGGREREGEINKPLYWEKQVSCDFDTTAFSAIICDVAKWSLIMGS